MLAVLLFFSILQCTLAKATPAPKHNATTYYSAHHFSSSVTNRTNDTSINPHPFNYTILETAICTKYRPDTELLIVVHTAPQYLKRRQQIRQTYGAPEWHKELKTTVVFFMGVLNASIPNANKIQASVRRESEQYHDIIQEDFIDTYRNLTYKAVMWLRWVNEYCNKPSLILKLDDDMVVDLFSIVEHTKYMHKANYAVKNTISCMYWADARTVRNTKSKWNVLSTEYSGEFYPTYCSGAAYVLTMDLVPKLLNESYVTRLFWIDDVYVTGVLAARVGAKFNQMHSAFMLRKYAHEMVDRHALFAHMPKTNSDQKQKLWLKVLRKHGKMPY